MVCHACHEPVGSPVCVGCGALQLAPAAVDPFGLLGLARRYHLDTNELETKYRKVARLVHPDKFVNKGAGERRQALLWTAHLNESRRVLSNALARARFLATGQAHPREQGGPKLDSAFLAEMFDWRERDEEQPGVMRGLAAERETELKAEIERIFVEWEEGRGDLSLVDDRLARLKYVSGLLQEMEH